MSRGAVERYARTSDAPRRMRQELAVGAVLTGSVRLAGDRARISVQLVDTRTEQAIWAQQYDERLNDILQLQSDVARQITTALQARLTGNEQSRLAQPTTNNAAAYELYLKAKGPRVNLQTIAMLKEAVRLDPKFGAAYAQLSRAQGQLGVFSDRRLFDDALGISAPRCRSRPKRSARSPCAGVRSSCVVAGSSRLEWRSCGRWNSRRTMPKPRGTCPSPMRRSDTSMSRCSGRGAASFSRRM